jgi:hypothetical protein
MGNPFIPIGGLGACKDMVGIPLAIRMRAEILWHPIPRNTGISPNSNRWEISIIRRIRNNVGTIQGWLFGHFGKLTLKKVGQQDDFPLALVIDYAKLRTWKALVFLFSCVCGAGSG